MNDYTDIIFRASEMDLFEEAKRNENLEIRFKGKKEAEVKEKARKLIEEFSNYSYSVNKLEKKRNKYILKLEFIEKRQEGGTE